jgi:hypothetical protein
MVKHVRDPNSQRVSAQGYFGTRKKRCSSIDNDTAWASWWVIGHCNATEEQIQSSVAAGAKRSTHLGNEAQRR